MLETYKLSYDHVSNCFHLTLPLVYLIFIYFSPPFLFSPSFGYNWNHFIIFHISFYYCFLWIWRLTNLLLYILPYHAKFISKAFFGLRSNAVLIFDFLRIPLKLPKLKTNNKVVVIRRLKTWNRFSNFWITISKIPSCWCAGYVERFCKLKISFGETNKSKYFLWCRQSFYYSWQRNFFRGPYTFFFITNW